MSIKSLVSKALCLTITAMALSVTIQIQAIPQIGGISVVHAESHAMGTAYKWDADGVKTSIPIPPESESIFSDSVLVTFDQIAYDSISVDKASKTVTINNLKSNGSALIFFGYVSDWTYYFVNCNYLSSELSGQNSLSLNFKGNCTIKMGENSVLGGHINDTDEDDQRITLIDTKAEFPNTGTSATTDFLSTPNTPVKFTCIKTGSGSDSASDDTVDFSASVDRYGNVTVPETVTIDGKTYKIRFSLSKEEIGTKGTYKNINYEVTSSTTAAVTGTVGKSKSLSIPDAVEINGKAYKVTTIAKGAFDGKSSLKSISIPSSVTKIEKYAFSDCKNLATIKLMANNLKTIDKHAFDRIKKNAKFKITAKSKSSYNKCVSKIKKSTDVKSIKTQRVTTKKK